MSAQKGSFPVAYTDEDRRTFLRALCTASDVNNDKLGYKAATNAIKQVYAGDAPSRPTLHRLWKQRHDYLSEPNIQKWAQRSPDEFVERMLNDGDLDEWGERKAEHRERLMDIAEGSVEMLDAYLSEMKRKWHEEGTPPDRKDIKHLIDGMKAAGNQIKALNESSDNSQQQAQPQQFNVNVFSKLNPKNLDDKDIEYLDAELDS